MSDYYRLNFDFALDPYGPDEHVQIFKALASNKAPNKEDLAVLPLMLRDFLASPGMLGAGNAHAVIGSPVQMVWHGESRETEHWPKSAEWNVRFCISMHDDWYGNGAFLMWMLMVDIVGENGLYCTEFTEGQKDCVTHYYKNDDDIVVVRMAAPFTPYWVPTGFPRTREEIAPHAKPLDLSEFKLGEPTRIARADREEAARQIEATYRAEGWLSGED